MKNDRVKVENRNIMCSCQEETDMMAKTGTD